MEVAESAIVRSISVAKARAVVDERIPGSGTDVLAAVHASSRDRGREQPHERACSNRDDATGFTFSVWLRGLRGRNIARVQLPVAGVLGLLVLLPATTASSRPNPAHTHVACGGRNATRSSGDATPDAAGR